VTAEGNAGALRRIEELTRAQRLRLLGQAKSALEAWDAIERARPTYGLLFQERGHCHVALGDSSRAIECFERAVGLNPALAESWAMLERLLNAAGEAQRASVAAQRLQKLQELPPQLVEAGGLFCDGEHAAAESLLTRYVAEHGRHVEALRLLGRIAQRRGDAFRAEGLFREVVEIAPHYADARLDYVRVLIERQTYPAALEQIEQRLQSAPADPEARFLKATILAGLGRHDDAVPIFRHLLGETPQRNHLRIVLGHSLKALGRAEDAVNAFRAAAAGHADIGDAYWSLANLKTYRFDDREIQRMRGLEALPAPGLPDRAHLCFALGKALEDRGDYSESWAFYERGNALMRAKSGYRSEAMEDNARRLIETCTQEFFAARSGSGAGDCDPIFIVGLPRSGSTLLEQILASHRQVDGTQELHDIPRIAAELRREGPNGAGPRYPELSPELDPALFERLGRRYLDETRVYRRGRPRFIDKMPNNFWRIGLIHLMLPNARIIDIRREPMACCVSNLKQLYARGQEFCYGSDEIARYYRVYLDLMGHWDRVLPGRVLRVGYEDLVEDIDSSVRRILDHCGLEFDPACLEFHRSRRTVNTPSSEQVRQPLFREGISQWRRFEPWLDPLKQALGDAVDRYRD
jgi:tetratricopeptide (TPR) repeat protein